MSTIGYESWAVDLAEVGAVYPFQGWEVPMTILGVIFWIGWHVVQFSQESKHLDHVRRISDPEKARQMIDRY
jgi:hypothetical protein